METHLHTARLLLRQPRLDDAEAIFTGYARDPEVLRYLSWRPHTSVETTRGFLRQCLAWWEQRTCYSWVITSNEADAPLGMIDVRPARHTHSFGFVLRRSAWGLGLMTEVLQRIVDASFDDPTICRIWGICDVENQASARVMAKAGLESEGLLRRYGVHPNVSDKPRDVYLYAMVR